MFTFVVSALCFNIYWEVDTCMVLVYLWVKQIWCKLIKLSEIKQNSEHCLTAFLPCTQYTMLRRLLCGGNVTDGDWVTCNAAQSGCLWCALSNPDSLDCIAYFIYILIFAANFATLTWRLRTANSVYFHTS